MDTDPTTSKDITMPDSTTKPHTDSTSSSSCMSDGSSGSIDSSESTARYLIEGGVIPTWENDPSEPMRVIDSDTR